MTDNKNVYYVVVNRDIPVGGKVPVIGWVSVPYPTYVGNNCQIVIDRSSIPPAPEQDNGYKAILMKTMTDQQWWDRVHGPYRQYVTDGVTIYPT